MPVLAARLIGLEIPTSSAPSVPSTIINDDPNILFCLADKNWFLLQIIRWDLISIKIMYILFMPLGRYLHGKVLLTR